MPTTHSVAAARWYAATQGDHFSAQAGDGQNELFLTPDNVLPPALLMWALVLTSFFMCSVTRGREEKHVCRCSGAERWVDCELAVIKSEMRERLQLFSSISTDRHRLRFWVTRWLQFPATHHVGSFGRWLNSLHYSVTPTVFSLPASDSFSKGQLEVHSSHTRCVWRSLQVKLQPQTPFTRLTAAELPPKIMTIWNQAFHIDVNTAYYSYYFWGKKSCSCVLTVFLEQLLQEGDGWTSVCIRRFLHVDSYTRKDQNKQ